ncbi:MAG TPA: glycoside hydrolase family 15 protein [Solirubrobacterales bacterium]|nr:glycoside hydrolase family 15 protein [Solirubrobacterales bacterium]
MKWLRGAAGLVALLVVGAALASGGSRTDSVQQRYLPGANALRTVARFGGERTVTIRSLGDQEAVRPDSRWLAARRPLGTEAPVWARRMYARSLLVLHALTDPRTGAVIAGARDGWAYVWPRDASAVAIALAAAGDRGQARSIVSFLRGLDLRAAARFHPDGTPVDGRGAQGDAAGWIAAAGGAAELPSATTKQPWRGLDDYQENGGGDFLANAIASGAPQIKALFGTPTGTLARRAHDPGSGLDSAAAWAVRPFSHPALYPLVRRTLLRLAAHSGRFGILPSAGWDGGGDPWTAPTAWTAWSLAALGERSAALHLMTELRRAATPDRMLPERVDARTGIPTSTTPLAWSHAFAILALRQLWPRTASNSHPSR